jgi:predicted permease
MFQTILQALVPVVFVAGLGWIVGRLGVLDPQRIRSVTTFVVTVAFPAAFTWAVALMGTWAVGFGLAHIVFRRTTPFAGMLAMNAGFPDSAQRSRRRAGSSHEGEDQIALGVQYVDPTLLSG